MSHKLLRFALASVLAVAMAASAQASEKQVARGKYLVTLGGCIDCHTPGYFLGKPDFKHVLGGSDVGFELPMGTFYGPNLTPDKETGLGNWTAKQIVTAIQTGHTPQGRELAPIMPWRALSHLTRYDAYAIAAYLKSLPPYKNQVIGPFGPKQPSPGFVMRVVPPQAAAPAPASAPAPAPAPAK